MFRSTEEKDGNQAEGINSRRVSLGVTGCEERQYVPRRTRSKRGPPAGKSEVYEWAYFFFLLRRGQS